MKLNPLGDRVLVQTLSGEDQSSGGIIIPDTAKEKPQKGKIVSVGPGMRDEAGKVRKMQVKKGDQILFGKYSGTELTLAGEKLLIMRESDILAVL